MNGEKFSRWTVVGEPFHRGNRQYVAVRCECGTEKTVRLDSLQGGGSRSCGCLSDELLGTRARRHGQHGSRLYKIWQGMCQRCTNPKAPNYRNYGGCGIRVCEQWHDVTNFIDWALDNGYRDDLTLDRTETNGNYTPDNCRWADASQQSQNRVRFRRSRTGYIGVYEQTTGRFQAQCIIRGRRVCLGSFDDPRSAAIARDQYVKQHGDSHATLNNVQN